MLLHSDDGMVRSTLLILGIVFVIGCTEKLDRNGPPPPPMFNVPRNRPAKAPKKKEPRKLTPAEIEARERADRDMARRKDDLNDVRKNLEKKIKNTKDPRMRQRLQRAMEAIEFERDRTYKKRGP